MKDPAISRRQFVRTSAVLTGTVAASNLLPAAVLGANDRIRVGVIGCGGQGTGHVSSRVIFGAAALGSMRQDKADELLALLFEHGVNDSRVDVWMTTKAGTRFAAANPAGKPVLMRLEYDAGHGVGSTRIQAQRRTADRWAFFLWHAGAPEFRPKP